MRLDLDQSGLGILRPVSVAISKSSPFRREEKAMKRFTVPAAVVAATLAMSIASPPLRADDAHHPAPGAAAAPTQVQAPPNSAAAPAETPRGSAPTTGQAMPRHGQGHMQSGQSTGGMMLNCHMMGGQAAQGGQAAKGGMNCPMMQGHSGGMGQAEPDSKH
jgi:hypothetical protein